MMQRAVFSGPLPHPTLLKQYEEVLPGSAERIMRMAEEQGDHRRSLEKVAIIGDNRRATVGQVMGFVITIICVAFGFVLVLSGRNLIGFGSIIVPLATLAGIFVRGSLLRRKERKEKREESSK